MKSIPMMPRKFVTALLLFALLCITSVAHAQADRGGLGGDWTESDLKHFLARIGTYLNSKDGKAVFPEVVAYDLSHPGHTVETIAFELNPRLVDRTLYDGGGNARDCVSYSEPVRYFECNVKSLPPKPSEGATHTQKSEYYGSLYRLVLHEVLVQTGIEKPEIKEVPSEYAVSSKLMVHLESFPEWVPGATPFADGSTYDIAVHHIPEWRLGILAGVLAGGEIFYPPAHLGLNLQYQVPITVGETDYKFGFSVGYAHSIKKAGDGDHWMLPILGTIERDFHPILGLKPYLRLGVGAMVSHQSGPISYFDYSSNQNVYEANASSTSYDLTYSITPGIMFGKEDQFFLEVQLGKIMNNNPYTIIGSFGMKF